MAAVGTFQWALSAMRTIEEAYELLENKAYTREVSPETYIPREVRDLYLSQLEEAREIIENYNPENNSERRSKKRAIRYADELEKRLEVF